MSQMPPEPPVDAPVEAKPPVILDGAAKGLQMTDGKSETDRILDELLGPDEDEVDAFENDQDADEDTFVAEESPEYGEDVEEEDVAEDDANNRGDEEGETELPAPSSPPINDETLGVLLTNGYTRAEVEAMPPSAARKTAMILAQKATQGESAAEGETPAEPKPFGDKVFDDKEREAIMQTVTPAIEKMMQAQAEQQRLQSEIDRARGDLEKQYPTLPERWSSIETRAEKMYKADPQGFTSVRQLIEMATAAEFAGEVVQTKQRQQKKATRSKALSTPTKTRSTPAAAPNSGKSASDIALEQIVDNGNMDVRDIRSRFS